jgi:hypothetical protein
LGRGGGRKKYSKRGKRGEKVSSTGIKKTEKGEDSLILLGTFAYVTPTVYRYLGIYYYWTYFLKA